MILLLLVGCLTWESGLQQRNELNCELLDVCGELAGLGYDSVEQCKEQVGEGLEEVVQNTCPDFDAAQMRACLDAYEDAIATQDCDADLSTVCDACS